MKRTKEFIKILLLVIVATFLINCKEVFADVGSFESYDSGSSWSSSSSWDSDSSWSSSSDYDGDYVYGEASFEDFNKAINRMLTFQYIGIFTVAFILMGILVLMIWNKKNEMSNENNYSIGTDWRIEREIKAVDEMFNKKEFLAWTSDLFVKLQQAWSKRDWSSVRTLETNELFEQHQKQIQGYISMKQINVMENVCVLSAELMDFYQTGDKDVLSVRLSSKMIDYIIDENTMRIVKGDKKTYRYSTYKLVFVREKGTMTQVENNKVNCPNCGAPTEIAASGKCEYCGSIITTDSYNWVLSNLEKIG